MAAASTSSSAAIIHISTESEVKELPKTTGNQSPLVGAAAPPSAAQSTSSVVLDTTLASVASLVKLLPSGTVLTFQALAPSFTDKGQCLATNKYLTAMLLYLCVATLVFFTFTDSFRGNDGKLYYGMATLKGMYVFNYDGEDADRRKVLPNLSKYKVRLLDYVHALFGTFVFLSVAFSGANVQNCYFQNAGENAKELLTNLVLGSSFFSSMVFIIFPTTRKGIGYSDSTTTTSP